MENNLMDFEKQKPITDEFRKNWDRVWATSKSCDGLPVEAVEMDQDRRYGTRLYRNGCPMLEETVTIQSEKPEKEERDAVVHSKHSIESI
jgi:hypothetical protein